jgi:hypothetical protein
MVSSIAPSSATTPVSTPTTNQTGALGAASPSAAAAAPQSDAVTSSATSSLQVTLSSNAQRLQTAEANLASDEASTPTGALAAQWNQDLASAVDSTTEASADAEVAALPSSDPAHIAQAQAAQAYVKARVSSGGNPDAYGANPFAGLSQTQLAAIANDKSGLYTSYEKTAALYESQDQTNAWVLQFQNDPQGQDGGFYREAQNQFSLLSPLQQSVYPSDYLAILKKEQSRESGATVQADASVVV